MNNWPLYLSGGIVALVLVASAIDIPHKSKFRRDCEAQNGVVVRTNGSQNVCLNKNAIIPIYRNQ